MERKQQRVLTKDGVFMSREMRSPQGSIDSDRDHGVRPKLGEGECRGWTQTQLERGEGGRDENLQTETCSALISYSREVS